MQTNITIMMNVEGQFVTSFIDNTGEEQFTPTNFDELESLTSEQPWVLMTRTITQYKYNKCGIMKDNIKDMLSYVKEELEHTTDICVLCHKPDMAVIFFKE